VAVVQPSQSVFVACIAITVWMDATGDWSHLLGKQIIVKTYIGREAETTMNFQADAAVMAAQGYSPVFQSWHRASGNPELSLPYFCSVS
jgi:hypothetical protein